MWIETARSLFRLTGAEVAAWERRLVDYPEDDIRKMMDIDLSITKPFDNAGIRLNRILTGLRQIVKDRLAEEEGLNQKPKKRIKHLPPKLAKDFFGLCGRLAGGEFTPPQFADKYEALFKKHNHPLGEKGENLIKQIRKLGYFPWNKPKEDDRDEFYKAIIAEKEA